MRREKKAIRWGRREAHQPVGREADEKAARWRRHGDMVGGKLGVTFPPCLMMMG